MLMTTRCDFGKRLRALMNQARLSYDRMAARSGLTAGTVYSLSKGRTQPGLPTIRLLAAALAEVLGRDVDAIQLELLRME